MNPRSMIDYPKTLAPVFDRHSVPESLRPDVVRFFTVEAPMTSALNRYSRQRSWPKFLSEARIAVGDEALRQFFANSN